MAKAQIYLRVSTEQQGESGLGLEAQESTCRAAAGRLGFDVGGVFVDSGISGSVGIEGRPGLLDATNGLTRGDILLVAKRDRLGRDPIAVAMIERLAQRKGARIVSAAGEGTESDDPTAVLMRRIIDSFAEYERLIIGARTKAALNAKRARGEKTGGLVPFGYTSEGGRLVENPNEQAVIGMIRTLKAEGHSVKSIVDALVAQGIATKSGNGKWTPVHVRRILGRAG